MQSLSDLLDKLIINDFEVGNSYWVDVTHINNPHSFYVRLTSCRTFMPSVQAYNELRDASELYVQSMVIFKSDIVNNYVRGQIITIHNNDENILYDMYTLDYGFFEKSVPIESIREICAAHIPPLATHCRLADCKPIAESWTEKANEAMKCFVGNEKAKMVVREKRPSELVVELINTCPDDIATMMALTGYSLFGYGANVISRLSTPQSEKHYFTYKELNVNDVLHVRIQSGKTLDSFYVTQMDDYHHYLNERNNFTYFSKKKQPLCTEDLKKDKPVGVYIDSICKYERAIIKEVTVPDKKATVQLMDWGKLIEVDLSKMRSMSEKFFYYPAAAIYCSVEESQLWDSQLHKYLSLGYEFLITIRKTGDKFNSPNIVYISPKT